jgi:hypothetical protein
MSISNIHLTSDVFWQSAALAALMDAGLLFLVLRLVRPARFFHMRLAVIVSAGVFWGILGVLVVRSFWAAYYQFFYPRWMGDWGIFVFGPSIGMVLAFLFYWIARRVRSHPIPAFFLAVGVEALLEHLMGIYSFRIMAIPMFSGVNPLSILAFSIPEYILYWSIILLAAFLVQGAYSRFRQGIGTRPAKTP